MKDKNHITTSIDAEKEFDKIQHSFMIKMINGLGMEGVYLNIKRAIYDRKTGGIILSGERMTYFPLRSGQHKPQQQQPH